MTDSPNPMPHDLRAESSVLGSILLDNTLIAPIAEILQPDHFYRGAYRLIYEAMLSLNERGHEIDLVTVEDELRRQGRLENAGGHDEIISLIEDTVSATNTEAHAKIVRDKAKLRELARVGQDIAAEAMDPTSTDADAVIESAEQRVFSVRDRASANRPDVPITETVVTAFGIVDNYHRQRGEVQGIPSGFIDLDRILGGFKPSEMTIIAARPSMGKSSLSTCIAVHAALEREKRVAIFSLETRAEQIVMNMISMLTPADAHKMRCGELPEATWEQFPRVGERLSRAPIYLPDSRILYPSTVRAKCRRYKATDGLDLAIVDYIGLMRPPKDVEPNRQQQIAAISRAMKELATELDIPVIALSQLNRAVDARAGNRPSMSDIRESGAIEQDADVILLLYRDDYYNPNSSEKGIAEVIIAKHRNGPTGVVKLGWQPEFVRFVNLAVDRSHA